MKISLFTIIYTFLLLLSYCFYYEVNAVVYEGSFVVPVGLTPGNVIFTYQVDTNTSVIKVILQASCKCWIGVGWHAQDNQPKMKFADYVVGIYNDATNTVDIIDRYVGNIDGLGTEPGRDIDQGGSNDIFNTSGYQIGSMTYIYFERLLTTVDNKTDIPIQYNNTQRFLFAYGKSNTYDFHYENCKIVVLNLTSGVFIVDNSSATLYITHGCLMVFAFAICMTFGIFVARFLRHRVDWWFKLHIFIQTIAVLAMCCAFGIAFNEVGAHFDTTHAKFGYFVVIFSILTTILGILADRMYNPERTQTPIFPDKVHWWLARVVIILAYVNIILGVYVYWGADLAFVYVFSVYLSIIALTFFAVEWMSKGAAHNGYAPINAKTN